MAQVSYTLEAQSRNHLGKGAVRRMRRLEAAVPAVIYGAGQAPVSITLNQFALSNALKNEGFYSHILTLSIDGKSEQVILRALQRHPYKPQIMHADFQRIRANEKLNMTISLHFKGDENCPGVKLQGGVASHLMSEVEIRCLPADLPEYLELDCSQMNLNDTLHLTDIPLPKGVEIVALMHGEDQDQAVISVHLPAEKEVEAVAAVPESAEVPVISKGKETEEGEEAKDSKK